MRFQVLAGFEP
jgi:hypothetical protein